MIVLGKTQLVPGSAVVAEGDHRPSGIETHFIGLGLQSPEDAQANLANLLRLAEVTNDDDVVVKLHAVLRVDRPLAIPQATRWIGVPMFRRRSDAGLAAQAPRLGSSRFTIGSEWKLD